MSKADPILSPDQQLYLQSVIAGTHKKTSGQLKLYMEHQCDIDVMDRAAYIFKELNIHNTKHHNGVLIYLASDNRKFAIIGDSGIHKAVSQHFWDEVSSVMVSYFKNGDLVGGLAHGIEKAAEALHKHYPHHKKDTHELTDDIAFGE